MSLLHLTKHKILPSSDAWFYLNTNKHFLTNIFFSFIQTSAMRKWYIWRKPGPADFVPFWKQSVHKTKTVSLWVLPHKTQSYYIKIHNLPKQEYSPEKFHQSIKYYKKLFLAPFSYHVVVLPQSVFQNQFFKNPLKNHFRNNAWLFAAWSSHYQPSAETYQHSTYQ